MAGLAVADLVSNPAEDRGPMTLAVFWGLTGLSGGVLSLRLYVRIKLRRLQTDDWILLLAWLCMLGVAILNQLLVNLGFGKHSLDVPFKNLERIATYGAAGLTVSIVGINAAKISFAVTLLHSTKNLWRWTNYLIWIIIVTLICFGLPVAIIPWVQCRPLVKTFVDFWPGECVDKSHSVRFGVFQGSWSALTDFALALLPWKILWMLQMRPVEKLGVGVAMSLGFVAGVLAILRSLEVYRLSSADISYEGAISTLWSTTELSATIIAACIPVLRTFFKEKVSALRSAGSTRKDSRLRRGNSTATPASSKAYQLSRLSGKFDAHKNKDGRWFTVADTDGDEEDGFFSPGTGVSRQAGVKGVKEDMVAVVDENNVDQLKSRSLEVVIGVGPQLTLPAKAGLK